MAAAKKKPQKPRTRTKILASDVIVDDRKLNAILMDLAERSKENDARSAQALERSARAEEMAARAEEGTRIALASISALLQDLRALAQRSNDRFERLEKAVAAE
jgi:hypothetical protein